MLSSSSVYPVLAWCLVQHFSVFLFKEAQNHYKTLGILLCHLRICSWRDVLCLVTNGQYGHWQWGFLPHSNLKCLERFDFHAYTFPHWGQRWDELWDNVSGSFIFWPLLIWTVDAATSWTIWLPSEYECRTWYAENSAKNPEIIVIKRKV